MPVGVLYDALCEFRDFRHLEVVWSGNKSFHIHVFVDSRHLARSRFAGEIEVPPGAYPEIPGGLMFRSGLMACWSPVEQIIHQTLEIEIPPDPAAQRTRSVPPHPMGHTDRHRPPRRAK